MAGKRVPLPRDDLDLVLEHTSDIWSRYSDAHVFVTGGTGFIGSWLLETILHANASLGSRIEVSVLTREADRALALAPGVFGARGVRLVTGDVASFDAPVGRFDLLIHAAGDASAASVGNNGLNVFDTMVNGTRRMLDLAAGNGGPRFLLTSSGAIYGSQPATLQYISESFQGAPDTLDAKAAYANGKRAAEWLVSSYVEERGIPATIARIFALVGPNLPLDAPFAAGNFVRDVLNGRAIEVQGDGRPVRSYLYMADLCIWLLRILTSGAPGQAYNVGSENEVSIVDLAQRILAASKVNLPINVARPPDASKPVPRYVPNTSKARTNLGLAEYTPLDVALRKTLEWARSVNR